MESGDTVSGSRHLLRPRVENFVWGHVPSPDRVTQLSNIQS